MELENGCICFHFHDCGRKVGSTVCFPGDRDLEMLVHLHTGSIGLWPRMPKSYLADFADDDGKMLLGKDDGDGDGGVGGGCCHSLIGLKVVVSKFCLICSPTPKLGEDEQTTNHFFDFSTLFSGLKLSFTQAFLGRIAVNLRKFPRTPLKFRKVPEK